MTKSKKRFQVFADKGKMVYQCERHKVMVDMGTKCPKCEEEKAHAKNKAVLDQIFFGG